jgi:glycosyltransferase involved in cell wall biosynthesis
VKVLVVSSYPPRHCGIGAYARDQVTELRLAGEVVTVLSPPDGDGDVRVPFGAGRPFVTAARMGGGFDRIVVHFQPALYYRPRAPLSKIGTSLGLLWLVLRRRRTEVLVHEVDTPIRWRPDYVLLSWALRFAPVLSFHTEAERAAAARAYGLPVRGRVVEHRVLPVAGPARPSREEARRRLGIEGPAPVFVSLGFLQPSKGFDRAVEAFAAAGGGSLFVVGSIRDATAENLAWTQTLRRRCHDVPGAALVERYLTDQEFDLWVAAADLLVLPYRRSWSSGVLARAHAMGTPAVVTAVGGLSEQAGPADMVVPGDAALAEALRAAVAGSRYAGTAGSPEAAKDRK